MTSYEPPSECVGLLGKVVPLLKHSSTRVLDGSRFAAHPAKHVCKLPDGTLFFENANDLDVDDDGFTSRAGTVWPAWRPADWVATPPHQEETSYGGALGSPEGWSAFLHQYIALPGALRGQSGIWWRKEAGLKIGDGAVVIKGSQWIICVFVDTGPGDKIGEMSLAAHSNFRNPATLFEVSHDPRESRDTARQDNAGRPNIEKVSRTTNTATPGPFITLVFPGTSLSSLSTTKLFTNITARFATLVGRRSASTAV
jgi:hypothetical protein